jgi:hypothetical protein
MSTTPSMWGECVSLTDAACSWGKHPGSNGGHLQLWSPFRQLPCASSTEAASILDPSFKVRHDMSSPGVL